MNNISHKKNYIWFPKSFIYKLANIFPNEFGKKSHQQTQIIQTLMLAIKFTIIIFKI